MRLRPRGRRIAAGFVCGASLLAIFPVVLGGNAGAADAPFTVTVDPVDLLGDGQLVTVTIKTTSSYPLVAAEMRICRLGPEYKTRTAPRPDPDFEVGGPNCPDKGVSTSADRSLTDTTINQNAGTAAGSVSRYRVGTGTIGWTAIGGGAQTLTCGPQDPCALVVEARGGKDGKWTPVVTQLNFKEEDPVAGCGGPADGILLSGGSDRMSDAWVGWTLDDCQQDGRDGGTSRLVPTGEGPAVSSFANGGLDFVYTAAGYGDEVGLLDETVEKPRQAIAVPVGINAAVLGVFGGRRNDTGVKVPYDDLKLTLEELAALLSGGTQGIQPHLADVFARNPELDGNFFDTGFRAQFNVAAPAEAESTSWFATNHLLKTVPGAWKVPDQPAFGEDAGRPRGADTSFAVADPSYAQALTPLTGRPPLAKAVAQVLQSPDTVGGAWVLTDLETATALGMTVVKIANVDGDFVPVTPASVTAGVESMEETDNGLLLPDPEATAPVDGVTPYPLSFVEYALVPAEPLIDDLTCTARTDSQALLTSWLEYITGPGQDHLPAGMVRLTPELQQRAAAAIAQVGTAAVTGECDGQVITTTTTTTTTTPTTPTSTGGTTATTIGSSPTTVRSNANRGGSVTPIAQTETPQPANPQSEEPLELVSVPGFAGRHGIGWVGTVLALLGIAGISGVAAFGGTEELPLSRRRRAGPAGPPVGS